ncbi:MAG: hypothetical protein LBH22_03745 [Bacteroidales bacterium]|jgi:hypothetical protein|nr:hypothetical protein [Bacteroidales bacterium]
METTTNRTQELKDFLHRVIEIAKVEAEKKIQTVRNESKYSPDSEEQHLIWLKGHCQDEIEGFMQHRFPHAGLYFTTAFVRAVESFKTDPDNDGTIERLVENIISEFNNEHIGLLN